MKPYASAIQMVGWTLLSGGLGMIQLWLGIVVLGIGLVLFGVLAEVN